MAVFEETIGTGGYLVSEAQGTRSREIGVLAAGDLLPGTVLAVNGDGKYVQLAPGAADGTEDAVGILYAHTDASESEQNCVVNVRDCEVNGAELTWPDGITELQKDTATSQLAGAGIIVRPGLT